MRQLTGQERTFGEDELIVSKTDPRGKIIYANDLFERLAGYPPGGMIGLPHSAVRHPAMPRGVFKLLWQTIKGGGEVFAFVINLAVNGDHYWVFAHITPTFDLGGNIIGFHSNRRSPNRAALPAVTALYRELSAEEARHADPATAATAGFRHLEAWLSARGLAYPELMFEFDAMRART
jgi:PAS domain S-box-containing protein